MTSDYINMTLDDMNTRAGEYVLGLLDGSERATFEAAMLNDPALGAMATDWQQAFAALNDEYKETEPTKDMWPEIADSLKLGRIGSNDNPLNYNQPGVAKHLARWQFATFASLGIAILLGTMLFLRGLSPPEPNATQSAKTDTAMVAQLTGDIEGLLLTASYNPDNGEMKVDVDGMPQTPTEPEIWLQTKDQTLVSLGQVGRDGISRMTLPKTAQALLDDGAFLILTMEPPSTVPHSRPSGAPVAKGRIALIT